MMYPAVLNLKGSDLKKAEGKPEADPPYLPLELVGGPIGGIHFGEHFSVRSRSILCRRHHPQGQPLHGHGSRLGIHGGGKSRAECCEHQPQHHHDCDLLCSTRGLFNWNSEYQN